MTRNKLKYQAKVQGWDWQNKNTAATACQNSKITIRTGNHHNISRVGEEDAVEHTQERCGGYLFSICRTGCARAVVRSYETYRCWKLERIRRN